MTAEQDQPTLSSREHHEQAVAHMRDGDMQTARRHLDLGISQVRQELTVNPTDTLRQRASELLTQDGRYWDRIAREAETPEDARRFRADALGSVQAALAIARESANDSLVVLPSVFLGDLQVRDNNLPGAISAYREALSHLLPENHTPAYTFVIQGKLHKTEYEADEKTREGADPLLAAEDALTLLENFSGEINPDDTTKKIWLTGGHLDITEAIARKHDGDNRDKAYAHYEAALGIIEKDAEKLVHRKEDAARVREVLEDDIEQEFAEAQILRNSGEEEKLRQALSAYSQVETHARILDDQVMRGHAIHMRGVTHYGQKDYPGADQEYVRAQEVFEQIDDMMLQAAVLRDRASVALKQEEFERAHKLIGQSIALLRKTDISEHLGMSLIKEAQVYAAENNSPAALASIQEGIQTVDQGGDTYFRAHARMNAAELLLNAGQLDEAEGLLDTAEDILTNVEENEASDIIFRADRNKIQALREQIVQKRNSTPSESQ